MAQGHPPTCRPTPHPPTWVQPSPAPTLAKHPLPTSHGLTQETTRPLKQGSLALSSEISSFTTLWGDSATRPPA